MAAVPARSSALEDALVNSLREKEAAVDAEIKALDKTVERAAEYEGADELEEIRRRRIEEMKREKNRNANCQPYEEIHDQKEFFNAVKECSKLVCHFYRPTTWRCQLVDKHLQQLSHRHGDIRFLKINAEKAPFLCDRKHLVPGPPPPSAVYLQGQSSIRPESCRCQFKGHSSETNQRPPQLLSRPSQSASLSAASSRVFGRL
eukprot:GHVT01007389.1.p1 GENE.GHVT01007389.1~~GHVT01007389.1.p1  ORF type:complete len:203 (+),score=33.25 GHVT01007389.1:536-1144(+)